MLNDTELSLGASSSPTAQRQEWAFLKELPCQASCKQPVSSSTQTVSSISDEKSVRTNLVLGSPGEVSWIWEQYFQHKNIRLKKKKSSWVQISSGKPWLNLKTKHNLLTIDPQEGKRDGIASHDRDGIDHRRALWPAHWGTHPAGYHRARTKAHLHLLLLSHPAGHSACLLGMFLWPQSPIFIQIPTTRSVKNFLWNQLFFQWHTTFSLLLYCLFRK